MDLAAIAAALTSQRLDAWLVHDFRHSNPVLARLLPAPGGQRRHLTRRVDLFIPASGKAVLLTSGVDAGSFKDLPAGIEHRTYVTRHDYAQRLGELVQGRRVAMEYSPLGALPVAGIVDAGTIELVRSLGGEVVSSADVQQGALAVWSPDAITQHARASELVGGIKDRAFAHIAAHHRAGTPVHEHDVARFIREGFERAGLEWPDGPIVAVNQHAADPHYEPGPEYPRAIVPGDWVLIDLWARVRGESNIFSDITWTGYCGREVPARHRFVFDAVRHARDASLRLAQDRWRAGVVVRGYELDQASIDVITAAGLACGIRHRTGHSLSAGAMVHGSGMNLDNLETQDTRVMLAGTGFTIEPGVYLPGERIGVRNEINVYVDPTRGPIVTSGVQDEPVLIV